jgi:hypothetical protein
MPFMTTRQPSSAEASEECVEWRRRTDNSDNSEADNKDNLKLLPPANYLPHYHLRRLYQKPMMLYQPVQFVGVAACRKFKKCGAWSKKHANPLADESQVKKSYERAN